MQMMMQMMQFAFFASFTLKHDSSKLNPDYTKNRSRRAPPLPHLNPLKSGQNSATAPPDPLTTHFVRKHNSAGAFYEGWLS